MESNIVGDKIHHPSQQRQQQQRSATYVNFSTKVATPKTPSSKDGTTSRRPVVSNAAATVDGTARSQIGDFAKRTSQGVGSSEQAAEIRSLSGARFPAPQQHPVLAAITYKRANTELLQATGYERSPATSSTSAQPRALLRDNEAVKNMYYRQASFVIPVPSKGNPSTTSSFKLSKPQSSTGGGGAAAALASSYQGESAYSSSSSPKADERIAKSNTTSQHFHTKSNDAPFAPIWPPRSGQQQSSGDSARRQQQTENKLVSQLLVYERRNSLPSSSSSTSTSQKQGPALPAMSKGPHISQAICKVKDPGGFDCYGFLLALPVVATGQVRYGLLTLSSFTMGQRTKKSLNLLVHFESSFRSEKPLEIPFHRWIYCKKHGTTFFELPAEAIEYVQYKRLEFLDVHRGKMTERQKVLILQKSKDNPKQHTCVVGEAVLFGNDGYFKHKVASLAGLPILDPLTFTVVGIQKGADFSGNELAVSLRAIITDMAPSKPENWTEADVQRAKKHETVSSSSSPTDLPLEKSEAPPKPQSQIRSLSARKTSKDENFDLIRLSTMIPDNLKDEICDIVSKYRITADELALRSENDLRLLFPRRDIQEAVYAWKRSIQIDVWRREKLPLESIRLHQAIKENDLGLVKTIIFHKSIPPGCRPLLVESRHPLNFKNTPLLQAALRGYLGIVHFLIRECNANVYAKDSHELESTPIHLAAAHGHFDVVAALLSYKSDLLEIKNKSNDTPLNRAAARGRFLITQFLVDKKFANIENRGELGRTPLMMAASWGHLAIVELLRDRGADVYVKDFETGSTAVHLAAYFGQANVVSYLVDKHPDLATVKNKHGKTPWARAKEAQKRNVMIVLQSRGLTME